MSYCALILFFSPLFQILEEIKAGRCVGEIGMPETAGSASRGFDTVLLSRLSDSGRN